MDSLSQFTAHVDSSEIKLPHGTTVFEEGEGKVLKSYIIFYSLFDYVAFQLEFSNVHFLVTRMKNSIVLQVPARLHVCTQGLVVQMSDKMKIFELLAVIKEIYHISDIREVLKQALLPTCLQLILVMHGGFG